MEEVRAGAALSRIFDIENKTAIITGAASGLGRVTASLFAELGANVVVADLDERGAIETAETICTQGWKATGLSLDVSSEASVAKMFEAVADQETGVDILVNCAAYRSKDELFEMTDGQWQRMLEVSLKGTFLCSREAIGMMRSRGLGGSIVNVSSVSSVHPTLWGINYHYDAAKGGVNAITQSLASEFAVDNIRINAVLPGGMKSEGAQDIGERYRIQGPMGQSGRIPLGRVAEPVEVAHAILFLASPAASYVTGQLLAVDGGFLVS